MQTRAIRLATGGVLAGVLLLLLWQFNHPWWRMHLQVDLVAYQQRALVFLHSHSWEGLGVNEYQPGALWFFVGAGWLAGAAADFTSFSLAVMFLNVVLLGWHSWYYARVSVSSVWLFAVLVAATGPILLFRFELLVSALVLSSWALVSSRRMSAAAFVLGLAAAVKVYPIVLWPLVGLEVLRQSTQRGIQVMRVAGAGAGGLLLPVILFFALGGKWVDVVQGLQFHHLKPIGLEGLWAAVLIPWHLLKGEFIRISPGYGVHGFVVEAWPGLVRWLDSLWVLPVGVLLAIIAVRWRRKGYTDPLLPFSVLLTFVFFSKVMNPQYLWWFVSFLPLLAPRLPGLSRWIIVSGTVIVLILTQIVYPISYTSFLEWFSVWHGVSWLFILIIVKNVLLGVILSAAVSLVWRSAPVTSE